MKTHEFIADAIESPLGRDERIDYKSIHFEQSPVLKKIGDVVLKKCQPTEDELWYGLFVKVNGYTNLVGILQLERYNLYWQVRLTQIDESYKSQGFGSLLYDYAVMEDGLTLLSDITQTSGDKGGSRGVWEKLYRQGRFTVCGYNVDSGEIISLSDSSEISAKIYNQKEDVVWMATPKPLREGIEDMLIRLNSKNKYRTITWYGPGVKDSI